MYNSNQNENEILKYWEDNKCFEKSVLERPENRPYVFYDGPPFATGLPHYGHIVASLMKDVVPRYWTMRGFRVERKWGWDCHGLPVENIIEKDLNLNSKKDIENYGVDKFNEACNATVLKYASEWKKTIRRMGRWVDMENDYKTMDIGYMESAWWVFKELWNKNLIYKGHKAMHICPRCVTPLSNFEVTQGYKDVKDISVVAKFKLKEQLTINKKQIEGVDGPVYILAWTTTPWTLPGNVLLAVNKDIRYVKFKIIKPVNDKVKAGDVYIVSREFFDNKLSLHRPMAEMSSSQGPMVFGNTVINHAFKDFEGTEVDEVSEIKGSDLVGLEYEPLFPYFVDTKNAFRIVTADFVTTTEGTGIVHIAPAFGEDDYNVGKAENIPLVQHVKMDGHFTDDVKDFASLEVKPKENPTATDIEIIKWLASNGKLFSKEKFEHSYPHCWRCDTPLLNYATSSWFIKVPDLRDQLLKNNEDIRWVPENFKQGRFGNWLEGARDWAVSRNRFWGNPLPVWESEDGDHICMGSVAELEKLSGQKITDLHKQFVDKIEFVFEGKKYRRVPEVLDCWFESGSMPYGQMHYPFENKEKFEAGFPAQFIAEGQDQTRGWFYTLHVLASALTSGKNPSIPKKESCPAFKNVIVNGIVLAEDGKKMSKRLKNYPEPDLILDKYGADAMRYYLVTAPVMAAEALNFSEVGVREAYNKVVNTLWNVVEFYGMYNANNANLSVNNANSSNVLDQWILAKLNLLVKEVTENMESYQLAKAARPIEDFITELSQWYVRRSRDRFKSDSSAVISSETKDSSLSLRDSSAVPQNDKQQAVATLGEVLLTLSKVMAPFTPFIAEKIYQEMGGEKESVHLEEWVQYDEKKFNQKVLDNMEVVRKIVEMGLALRAEAGIKVKQPLAKLIINNEQLTDEFKNIIGEELNIKEILSDNNIKEDKEVMIKEDGGVKIALHTQITDALKAEGLSRELIRAINLKRKEINLFVGDVATVEYQTSDALLKEVMINFADEIKRSTVSEDIKEGKVQVEEIEVDGRKIALSVHK